MHELLGSSSSSTRLFLEKFLKLEIQSMAKKMYTQDAIYQAGK